MDIVKRFSPYKIFLVMTLPILYTIFYLMRNTQLPGNDAANYFQTAINIYQHFQGQGILRGLIKYYTERGWRPIFFPNLAVPFLLISHGNLFVTYWATALLCVFASIVYTYLYFRLMLERVSASIAASLVCLLPYIQAQVVMFYSEGALFPCIIGGLYHLIRSDYLRKLPHVCAFVLLTALALVLRPVEAATHLMFVFILFFSMGYYLGIFTIKEISRVVFFSLLTLFLFLAVAYIPYLHGNIVPKMDNGGLLDTQLAIRLHYAVLGSLFVTFVAGIFAAFTYYHGYHNEKSGSALALKTKNYLVPAFIAVFGLILLWFLPFSSQTLGWIYQTSLGDIALGTGSLSGSSFSWDVLKIYLREEGLLAVGVIIMTSVLALILVNSDTRKKLLFSAPVIYLILLAPFSIWEAFCTVQIITRKLSITFPALLMAMLLMALQQGKWGKIRVSIITLLVIIQFGLLLALLYTKDYQNRNPILNNSIGYFIPQPSTINPNPHAVVLDFFRKNAVVMNIHAIGLETLPGTPDARHPRRAEPIDPFLLGILLQASKSPYYANYIYFSTYSPENVKKIPPQYNVIFLSDRLNDMQISAQAASSYHEKFSTETNPSYKTYYELLYYYSLNQLQTIGWKPGPCIVLNTQKNGQYRACLLTSMLQPQK